MWPARSPTDSPCHGAGRRGPSQTRAMARRTPFIETPDTGDGPPPESLESCRLGIRFSIGRSLTNNQNHGGGRSPWFGASSWVGLVILSVIPPEINGQVRNPLNRRPR